MPNTAVHGGGGCVAVDEILKHEITHIIAGGMGMGAQNKFAQANVQVFGFVGSVKDAINSLINNSLNGFILKKAPSGTPKGPSAASKPSN